MNILIKPMETDEEIKGKAYVHWKAWQEAYCGLIDPNYLNNFTLERCTRKAFSWVNDILVAKDNDKVIGFVGYGSYRDDSLVNTGEVYALYILEEYYDKKIGYALMSAALEKLSKYRKIAVWVLESNQRAIRFYKRCGFQFDGTKKEINLGTVNSEVRMILTR